MRVQFSARKYCRVLGQDLNRIVTELQVRRKKKVIKHQSTSWYPKQVLKLVLKYEPDSIGNIKIRRTGEVKVSKLSHVHAKSYNLHLQ